MKKIILAGISLAFIPGIVAAQQKKLPDQKQETARTQGRAVARGGLYTFSQLDQRKIYNWANGQRSTPTGRLAGEHLPKYVRVIGDSAIVVKAPEDKSITKR